MDDEIKTTDLPVENSAEDRAALANSANKAPPVPLAGVPETPLPDNGGDAGLGPAVPSTDHYLTEASPIRRPVRRRLSHRRRRTRCLGTEYGWPSGLVCDARDWLSPPIGALRVASPPVTELLRNLLGPRSA